MSEIVDPAISLAAGGDTVAEGPTEQNNPGRGNAYGRNKQPNGALLTVTAPDLHAVAKRSY